MAPDLAADWACKHNGSSDWGSVALGAGKVAHLPSATRHVLRAVVFGTPVIRQRACEIETTKATSIVDALNRALIFARYRRAHAYKREKLRTNHAGKVGNRHCTDALFGAAGLANQCLSLTSPTGGDTAGRPQPGSQWRAPRRVQVQVGSVEPLAKPSCGRQ